MEFNEQTELTSSDRLIDRQEADSCQKWCLGEGDGGIEQKRKKEKKPHGHGQQCSDCLGEGGGRKWRSV